SRPQLEHARRQLETHGGRQGGNVLGTGVRALIAHALTAERDGHVGNAGVETEERRASSAANAARRWYCSTNAVSQPSSDAWNAPPVHSSNHSTIAGKIAATR